LHIKLAAEIAGMTYGKIEFLAINPDPNTNPVDAEVSS